MGKGQKQKRPQVTADPSSRKSPRATPESWDREAPTWRVGLLDWEGPWGWSKVSVVEARRIQDRLRLFEAMTWAQIQGGRGSHSVSIDQLVSPARRRLEELGLDDIDELFSLRMNGKPRLWGIRDRAALKVLWWDPNHEVCPSEKKRT